MNPMSEGLFIPPPPMMMPPPLPPHAMGLAGPHPFMPRSMSPPHERGLYYDSVVFSDLHEIDKNILYRDFEQKASPYTYVMKIVDLNRERLQMQYRLRTLFIDYEAGAFHVRGEVRPLVTQAVQRVVNMLKEPVFTLRVNPDFVVVLRILKDVKKDFSACTGCWLHFIWVSRTVACYGLDGNAASEYVQRIIQTVRRCAANPAQGYNGCFVTEQQYDRKYKNLIKKHVDYLEGKSGAKVAIKKDDVASGVLVVQYYGQHSNIQEAYAVMERDIISQYVDDGEFNPPDEDPLMGQFQSFGLGGGAHYDMNAPATSAGLGMPTSVNTSLSEEGFKPIPSTTTATLTSPIGPGPTTGGSVKSGTSPIGTPTVSPVGVPATSSGMGGDPTRMLHMSGNPFAMAFGSSSTAGGVGGNGGAPTDPLLPAVSSGISGLDTVGTTSRTTESPKSLQSDGQKVLLMQKIFELVESSGDTKWVTGLLQFIHTQKIDLGELINFIQSKSDSNNVGGGF